MQIPTPNDWNHINLIGCKIYDHEGSEYIVLRPTKKEFDNMVADVDTGVVKHYKHMIYPVFVVFEYPEKKGEQDGKKGLGKAGR